MSRSQQTDKLDRSIADTERFIIIEQALLNGSQQAANVLRASSSSRSAGPEAQARVRQAELNVEQSKARLDFLRNQLDKKKRRRAGAPKIEEKKWTNQLDLIRADTPLSVPRISHMLNHIEFKLKVEDQYKQGREKMANALANATQKDDKKEKARLMADQQESNTKVKLLRQAQKKYGNLLCDEDEEDEVLKDPVKEAINRKPVSGKLRLSLKAARDLDHAPVLSKSSKHYNETTVEFMIHGNVRNVSMPSRTDRWMQDFGIEMDKADEVEIAFYDQEAGHKNPPPRVLIGVLWVKVSDLLEALRRQKVEGLDGDAAGWVTAATVRGQDGRVGQQQRNGVPDVPLGSGPSYSGHGQVPGQGGSGGGGGAADGIDGWFQVEPQGAVSLHLDFVKENVRRRPLEAGGLGRQGAVKKRKGEVHEMNGHKFIKKQFFQVILCALCNKFLMTGDGYQCEDCRYMCHEACYQKVLTKCISKPNNDENDEDRLNYNIPHRFEPYSNITTNWCCHCGFLLPIGRKVPRKCNECALTCHEQCAHLVPNFCGMSMEKANAIIGMMKAVKSSQTDGSRRPGSSGRAPPPRIGGMGPPQGDHSPYSQQQQQAPPPPPSRLSQQQAPPSLPQQSSLPSLMSDLSVDSRSSHGSAYAAAQDPYRLGGGAPPPPPPQSQYQQRPSYQESPQKVQQQPLLANRPLPPPPAPFSQPLVVPEKQGGYPQLQQQTYPPVSSPSRPPTQDYSRPPPVPPAPVPSAPTHYQQAPLPQQPQFQQPYSPQLQQQVPPQVMVPLPPLQPQQVVALPLPTQPLVTRRRAKIGLEDFNFLTVLGKGNFGKVMLAEEKKSSQLYAIKVLKKEFIIENDEVDSTKSEKRVFLAAAERKHPFLLNLHSCFQTETRIYFVMEYISGGDLMLHIQRKQFTFRQAKFYAAEVLLALEYFHQKGIIYRDLKLDNILLTVEGHIKVADYGLCKEDMWYGKTTSTFCGTPEFMAPEILLEQRYGRAVDWWAFGVLTYEMLLGQSPFRGDDEDEIFDAILEDPPLYPITMPPKAVTLLQSLLERDPTKRLGSGENDALDIKRHPFFADVDFDAVYNKQIPPTYFPNVKNALDTTNFDTEFTNEQPTLTPVHGRLNVQDQEEFQGFSWIANWAA